MSSSKNLKALSDSVRSHTSSAQVEPRSSDKAGSAYFLGITMQDGYIKLWRKLAKSTIYHDTHAKNLLIHILLKAQWQSGNYKAFFKGKEITLKEGQIITGRHKLANELNEPRSTVWDALKRLTTKYKITVHESDSKATIITVLNWATYQNENNMPDRMPDNNPYGGRTGADTKQEYKNIRKKEVYIQDFEDLWFKYPNKDGKREALRHFNKSVKSPEDVKQIAQALDNYLNSRRVKDGYVKNGSTWFNNWRDWINHEEAHQDRDQRILERLSKK